MGAAFTKLVGSPHGVGLGDGVGVTTGVGLGAGVGVVIGVGLGVGPVAQPLSRKIWSGAAGSIPQVIPLLPQVVQAGTPKPPPGFCQAAGELVVNARSVQPHWPPGVKFKFAWTETQ